MVTVNAKEVLSLRLKMAAKELEMKLCHVELNKNLSKEGRYHFQRKVYCNICFIGKECLDVYLIFIDINRRLGQGNTCR